MLKGCIDQGSEIPEPLLSLQSLMLEPDEVATQGSHHCIFPSSAALPNCGSLCICITLNLLPTFCPSLPLQSLVCLSDLQEGNLLAFLGCWTWSIKYSWSFPSAGFTLHNPGLVFLLGRCPLPQYAACHAVCSIAFMGVCAFFFICLENTWV